MRNIHCVESVRIQRFSDPYFPLFGLNTERYSVSLRIQYECGKIRTRKTPNTDTFYVVEIYCFLSDVLETGCNIPIGKDSNAYLEPRQTSMLEPF